MSAPITEAMTLYTAAKPETAGVYLWKVPSIRVPGLVVTFCAHMRERNAGYRKAISPSFDYWNGYDLLVPAGTEWGPAPAGVVCEKDYQTAQETPVGVDLLPCPYCRKIPAWHGVESHSGGTLVGSKPHEWNNWWLSCCQWSRTPHMNDPRELAKLRNEAIGSSLTAAEKQRDEAWAFLANRMRENSRAIGPRWWCLREDLKAKAICDARTAIDVWTVDERATAAKYNPPTENVR
jgi:hypothetical protein